MRRFLLAWSTRTSTATSDRRACACSSKPASSMCATPPRPRRSLFPADSRSSTRSHTPGRRTGRSRTAPIRRTRLPTAGAHVNRLGNLTLVTQPLNSSMSNAPWVAREEGDYSKREELATRSVLLINQQLVRHNQWDESRIDARGADFAERILRTWPGPNSKLWRSAQAAGVPPDPRRSWSSKAAAMAPDPAGRASSVPHSRPRFHAGADDFSRFSAIACPGWPMHRCLVPQRLQRLEAYQPCPLAAEPRRLHPSSAGDRRSRNGGIGRRGLAGGR